MRKPWTTVRLGALAFAAGLMLSAPALGANAPDPWITTKVKVSLLTAEGVHGLDVNVDTVEGRVTLHGKLASAAEKERAEQIAKQVQGVHEVRNLIRVVPDARRDVVESSDEGIRKEVAARLASEPELADVSVASVNHGVVLLRGKTDTLSAHLRALEVTRAVDGVRRVASEIRSPDTLADEEIWRTPDVASSGSRSTRQAARDLWITSDAKVRLFAADLSALDVNVDTRNGDVTLFGMVASPAEEQRALEEVRKVEGVRVIRDELQVVPKGRRQAADRKDDQIERDVKRRVDDRVGDRGDVTVEVADGIVRLSGTVASQNERLAALTAARASEGVRSVVGDLRVERN